MSLIDKLQTFPVRFRFFSELILARQFYKAQAIEWVPLDEAVEKAKSLDRPIHVVSTERSRHYRDALKRSLVAAEPESVND